MASDSSSSSGSSSGEEEAEWVDSCDYGEASYWEGYYKHHAGQRGTDTEWYAPLAAFVTMMPTPAQLAALAPQGREARTLVLGCGNSELSEHLRDAGYGHIVSVDISEVCVQQMREQHAGDSRLSFEVADVRDMKQLFADGCFELVVDKATLDAVFIATGTGSTDGENFAAVDDFLRESRRVLVDGGALVSLSHMDRAGFFTPPSAAVAGDSGWTVDAARLWRVDKAASGNEQRFGYYAYVCQVGERPEPEPEPEPEPAPEPEPEPAAAAAVARQDRLETMQGSPDSRGGTPGEDKVVLDWTAAREAGRAAAEAAAKVWFELEPLPSLTATSAETETDSKNNNS